MYSDGDGLSASGKLRRMAARSYVIWQLRDTRAAMNRAAAHGAGRWAKRHSKELNSAAITLLGDTGWRVAS